MKRTAASIKAKGMPAADRPQAGVEPDPRTNCGAIAERRALRAGAYGYSHRLPVTGCG